MFYAHFVLSKKGPLARIWLAAHWDKKLTKAHVFETNIEGSVEAIIQPKMKLALRTSGHLLLGVVRIYSRKAKYLLADCNEAFVKIKMAFRPGAVDLPEENREAAMAAITLPEDFHEFDTAMADLTDIDVHTQFAVNQSRPEEITMREDLGNITLIGDDGFGDMGFDAAAGMLHDANLDDSLYKSADSAACFLLGDAGPVTDSLMDDDQPPSAQHFSPPHDTDTYTAAAAADSDNDDYEGPAGVDDDDDDDDNSNCGNYGTAAEQELFGENFSGEAAGLFEEPTGGPESNCAEAVSVSVAGNLLDTADNTSQQQLDQFDLATSHKTSADMFLSPSRTPRYALSDVTQQQNYNMVAIDDMLTTAPSTVDHTTLLPDDTEAFALEPIDITAIGTERKVRKKRRLVIDEMKSIASETMKLQLSDTTEIISTLDLAPPTKKLMHWKETGGVEKLFAFPGKQIVSKKLSKLFSMNLVTRSGANSGDMTQVADNNDMSTSEQYRQADSRLHSLAPADVSDMPELAPALQDSYVNPASVAPCIVDSFRSPRRRTPAHSSSPSRQLSSPSRFPPSPSRLLSSPSRGPASPSRLLSSPGRGPPSPSRLLPSPGRTLSSPAHPMSTPSHMKSPEYIPTLAPYGGSDDENDDDAGCYDDNNDDDDDDDDMQQTVTEQQTPAAESADANVFTAADTIAQLDDETTLEPVEEETEVAEGQEAEAEERRWNKRSQQMLVALRRCLLHHESVTFRQMAPPSASNSRKQAAAKFYTFLVLKKNEAIHLSQHRPFGDIDISRGLNFDMLA